MTLSLIKKAFVFSSFFCISSFAYALPADIDSANLILKAVRLDSFTTDGNLKDNWVADKVKVHEGRLDATKISGWLGKENEKWYISANKGTIPKDGGLIFLEGDVLIEQKTGNKVLFETQTASVNTNSMQLHSDDLITIISQGVVTEAVGIDIDIKSEQVKLRSKVKTHHEKNN